MLHVFPRLVGPITAYGGQTYVTAQTGTGTTFVMQTSPTITTPTLSGPVSKSSGQTSGDWLEMVRSDGTAMFKWINGGSTGNGDLLLQSNTGAGYATGITIERVSQDLTFTGSFKAPKSKSASTASGDWYEFVRSDGVAMFKIINAGPSGNGDFVFQGNTGAGYVDFYTILRTTKALNYLGDIAVNTNKFTVASSSGNTVVAGTLDVTGAITGSSSITDSKADVRTIPQNSKSAAYTTVLSDAGKHILHPSADTTARTFTIDSNANVAYPIGTAITFVNQNSAGTLTISITSDTMRLAGPGTTGSRTLTANGVATALKITSTEWIIWGVNLS